MQSLQKEWIRAFAMYLLGRGVTASIGVGAPDQEGYSEEEDSDLSM